MTLRRQSKVYRHYKHVLIMSNVEVHAKRDFQNIKVFGSEKVAVFASGAEGLDYLNSAPVDLILCDSSLNDMDGIRFTQVVRRNMNLRALPVIMITLENKREFVLDAIAAGCVGYVLRPYSLETFERYLILAQQLGRYPEIEEDQLQEAKEMVTAGDFDGAIEAFDEIVSYQDEAQHYYDMGCDFLMQQKYGKAIVAFKKAVKINDLFAEAYKGLADAYKGKGDLEKCREYLEKAAEVYAQFDRMEETKSIFIEILKYKRETPNPYNTLGVALRRQGDYMGALRAYKRALELTPQDENIYFNIAKAYYYMGDVEKAGLSVIESLNRNPRFPEAERLYTRIYEKPWTVPEGTAEREPGEAKAASTSAVDA